MKKQRKLLFWGMLSTLVVSVLAVTGIAVWSTTGEVLAGDSGETSVGPAAVVSVIPESAITSTTTAPWGVVRVGPMVITPVEGGNVGDVEQTTGDVHTDIPESAVTIIDAAVNVTLPAAASSGVESENYPPS